MMRVQLIALWFGIICCLFPIYACDVLAEGYQSDRAAGTTAIDYSFTATAESWVQEVRLKLGAVGGAGNLSIYIDRVAGPSYDAVYITKDMTAIQNYVFQPDSPIVLHTGDKLRVTWANGSGIGYGLETIYTKGWTR